MCDALTKKKRSLHPNTYIKYIWYLAHIFFSGPSSRRPIILGCKVSGGISGRCVVRNGSGIRFQCELPINRASLFRVKPDEVSHSNVPTILVVRYVVCLCLANNGYGIVCEIDDKSWAQRLSFGTIASSFKAIVKEGAVLYVLYVKWTRAPRLEQTIWGFDWENGPTQEEEWETWDFMDEIVVAGASSVLLADDLWEQLVVKGMG